MQLGVFTEGDNADRVEMKTKPWETPASQF